MNKLMKELGYCFNQNALRREYAAFYGKEPSAQAVHWFEAVSPFLVIAYQKGLRHEPLLGVFPFLEKMEAAV